MRQLLLVSSLFSILLVPHFSYAADHAMHQAHHHRAYHHAHVKADNTQPVNINTADATTLATLKGVGPKRAEEIITYRQVHGQFANADGLSKVKGIGAKGVLRLEKNNPNRIVTASK